LDARVSYFRTRVFLISSVSTNCTGISTALIPKKPIRTLMYYGSPSGFANTLSAIPIFCPTGS
jgi:hypothetical protein